MVQAIESAKKTSRARQDWQECYLAWLSGDKDPVKAGQSGFAATKAGISVFTVIRYRDANPEFAALEDAAMRSAHKHAETECYRRAIEGWDENRGEYSVRRYSDKLMERVLEHSQTGSWSSTTKVQVSGEIAFTTADDRRAALAKAREKAIEDVRAKELPVVDVESEVVG